MLGGEGAVVAGALAASADIVAASVDTADLRVMVEATATVAPDIGAVGGATVEPRSGLGL